MDRRGEFALRASLGASRASIGLQQFVETSIICAIGAASGLLLAWWLLPVILSVYPAAIPIDAELGIDLPVILAMIAVVAAAALIAGTIGNIRRVSRLSERPFSVPAQPFPLRQRG